MHQAGTLFMILLLHLPAWSRLAPYEQNPNCSVAYKNFNKRFKRLEQKYKKISLAPVSDENKPTWSWGTNHNAVYLLHGFIGSPEEMSNLAKKLEEEHYTVINDLIPGYGADGFVANKFTPPSWVAHVEANLHDIRQCFSAIHLVGFSTGALLIHDYLRHHTDDFKPQGFILYSPFYQPHLAFVGLLDSAARLLTPIVLTKPLYFLTRFPDIRVAVLKPENYLQELPLDGASYVLKFGSEVSKEISQRPLADDDTPVMLFVSDADQIMNLNVTLQNVSRDFSKLKIVRFHQLGVPHHLMVSEVSPVADEVIRQSVDFIQSQPIFYSSVEYKSRESALAVPSRNNQKASGGR